MADRMTTEAAHKRWWQIFEVVFGIPFLAAIALQFVMPLTFPGEIPAPARILAGAAFVVAGVAVVVAARRDLTRHGQPIDPGRATNALVTTGVFSISRNPLYLGGVVALAGIALVFNLPWVLALLPLAIVACHYILIAPEERYLAATFGAEYTAYAASVRRWLGRKSDSQ
ncbi:MAG: isoprenylcysteine carboxylmethyltransferase family protein [Anaerolineae bacterium]